MPAELDGAGLVHADVPRVRASELYYVTTSGGPFDGRFGYDYWKTIAQDCFGIPTVKLLEAENLDIVGADAEKIVDDAIKACGPA